MVKRVRFGHTIGNVDRGAVAYPLSSSQSVQAKRGEGKRLSVGYGTIVNPGLVHISARVVAVIGPPEHPRGLVLAPSGQRPKRGQIVSFAPSVQLPQGVLARVTSSRSTPGGIAIQLRSIPVEEVAPVLNFDVGAEIAQSARASSASASCRGISGIDPLLEFSNARLEGSISTVAWGIPSAKLLASFDVSSGIDITAGAGLECSLSAQSVPVRALVPPGIPVYATISGGLSASLAAGGDLRADIKMPVEVGGETYGVPPALLWRPLISLGKPSFDQRFAKVASLSAGADIGANIGVGDPLVGNAHISIDNGLDFSAAPGACSWDLNLGRFSAGGKLLRFSVSTPSSRPAYHRNLWSSACGSSGGGGPAGGAPVGGGPPTTLPTPGPPGPKALQVTTGENACALLAGGAVDCWGDNQTGELGNGTDPGEHPPACAEGGAGVSCSTAPVEVSGISDATDVSAGDSGTVCAVLSWGGVECWGRNSSGELGAGTDAGPDSCAGDESCSTTPVPVSGIVDATQISVGQQFACALLAGGTVECWGDTENLGDGEVGLDGCPTLGNEQCSPVPMPVSGITEATEISAGTSHACALLASGSVECWGRNEFGQLGNGTDAGPEFCQHYACSTTPVPVSGLTDAKQISAGGSHTCALRTGGSVDCWGYNGSGELGNGTNTGPEECDESAAGGSCSTAPIPVSGLGDATQISAGWGDTCAVLSGGDVNCWGGNPSGQLGVGTTTGPDCGGGEYACYTTPVAVSGLSDATQASTPDQNPYTCALRSGGSVACWGDNLTGALGNGTTADSSVPVRVSDIGSD